MRRTHAVAASIIVVIIFIIFATVVFCSNELLRKILLHSIQNYAGKGAIRRSGARVSLHAASLSFGCHSSRDGGDVNAGGDVGRIGGCWNLELRHLHIRNAPVRNKNGDNETKDWSSPYAVHLNSLRLSVPGPLAYLSVLQIPIATSIFDSPSFPRLFCNGLDFAVGFRVISIAIFEIAGLTIFVEEHEEKQGSPKVVIKSGLLRRIKGIKHQRQYQYMFVLERSKLSWFEQFQRQGKDDAQGEATSNSSTKKPRTKQNKPRGSIRLFSSSSVEIIGDQLFDLELISNTDHVVLRASSTEERDSWVNAISRMIADSGGGGGYSNSPWIDELAAEANARKVRWQQLEKRQRYQWQLQWQSSGDIGQIDVSNDVFENEVGEADIGGDFVERDDREDNEENDEEIEGRSAKLFLAEGINNLYSTLERRGLNAFEDTLEWRIGQLSINGLVLHINDRRWFFDGKDWMLRGFVGTSRKLRRRLRLEVGPKLLLDSSGQVISGYTGKEGYAFGDLTVATVTKMGTGVADAVQGFTGKEQYEFGDISKAAVNKIGSGVADAVQEFTGKEQYVFGDISKATVNKMGTGVAGAVQGFTGKEQYVFGDVSKATVNKMGAGVADAVQGFTGKEQYEFGDVTKAVFSRFRPRRSKVVGGEIDESNTSMRKAEL